MTNTEILRELEELSAKLSFEISYESLKKTAPYVKSGVVKLKEKKMILIEKKLNMDRKIKVILRAIRDEELGEIFVKPFIKDLISRERNK